MLRILQWQPLLAVFTVCFLVFCATSVQAEITAVFAGADWDGKTIPNGQQCSKQGGSNPQTPALKITNIPVGTKFLLMVITDENAGSPGQHGIFRFAVPARATEVIIPAIAENASDMPKNVSIEQGEGWGASTNGHYLPPCSNRRGHAYYSDIKALDVYEKKIEATYIDWGRY